MKPRSIGIGLLISAAAASLISIDKSVVDLAAPIQSSGEVLRLIITAIAIVIAAYVIYSNRNEKAKDEAIEALKNAVGAHKAECEALALRLKTVDEANKTLQAECISLKTKTDISEVLKMITSLSSTVTQEQSRSMEMIQVMLKNVMEQLSHNQEALDEIIKIVTGWKFGAVNRRTGRGTDKKTRT